MKKFSFSIESTSFFVLTLYPRVIGAIVEKTNRIIIPSIRLFFNNGAPQHVFL
jgi:hypothetical protein